MPVDSTATTIANSDAESNRFQAAPTTVTSLELALETLAPADALIDPRLKHAFQKFFWRGTVDQYLLLGPSSFRDVTEDRQYPRHNGSTVSEDDPAALGFPEAPDENNRPERNGASHNGGSPIHSDGGNWQSSRQTTAVGSGQESVDGRDDAMSVADSTSTNNRMQLLKRKRTRQKNSDVPDPKRVRLLVDSITEEELHPEPLLNELQRIMLGSLDHPPDVVLPSSDEIQPPMVTALRRTVGQMWKSYRRNQYHLNCVGRVLQTIIFHYYEYFMTSPAIPFKKSCGRGRRSYAYDTLTKVTHEGREVLEPLNSITRKLMELVSRFGLSYILRISGNGSTYWNRNLRSVDFEHACEKLFHAMKPEDESSKSDCDFQTARFMITLLGISGLREEDIVGMNTSLTRVLRHHVDFTRLQQGDVVPNSCNPCRKRRSVDRGRSSDAARVYQALIGSQRTMTTTPSPGTCGTPEIRPQSESQNISNDSQHDNTDAEFLNPSLDLDFQAHQLLRPEDEHIPSYGDSSINIESYQPASWYNEPWNLPQGEVPNWDFQSMNQTLFPDVPIDSTEL